MVIGMESFREKFKDYADCYTVIGGAACDILMSESDFEFRTTKDIDMILILEGRHKEFIEKLWELNDDYYDFMMHGRKIINGIGVLDAEHIIPFKMCAWLDQRRRKKAGEHVNERDLKKHKNDVFRMLQIISLGAKIESIGLVKQNIIQFLEVVKEEELRLEQIKLPFAKEEALEFLREVYL